MQLNENEIEVRTAEGSDRIDMNSAQMMCVIPGEGEEKAELVIVAEGRYHRIGVIDTGEINNSINLCSEICGRFNGTK